MQTLLVMFVLIIVFTSSAMAIRYEHYLADRQINLKRHAYEVIGVGHSYEDIFASRCGLNALFELPDEKVPAGAVCRDVTS